LLNTTNETAPKVVDFMRPARVRIMFEKHQFVGSVAADFLGVDHNARSNCGIQRQRVGLSAGQPAETFTFLPPLAARNHHEH
jgi:hypothetical protein